MPPPVASSGPVVVMTEAEQAFWQAHARARTPVTTAIALTIALVFGLELLWGGSENGLTLRRMGANVPRLMASQPWRMLSSAFLHFGSIHLLFNVTALLALGHFVERVLGSARFLVLYAVAAAGGGVASALLTDSPLSVGASGAVWGLMGAELVLTLRRSSFLPDVVRLRTRRSAVPAVLVNVAISFLPGIDLWAHLGGGAAGAALVASGLLDPATTDGARPATGLVLRCCAFLSAAILVGALLYGWSLERPWAAPDPMRILEMSVVSPSSRGNRA